jgi:uncharacterized protein DUF3800
MRELVSLTGCKVFAAMGLLRVYVDDSADQHQDQVVLAGAFVGWYHQWNDLQKKWRKRLKADGLDYYHATECRSLQGEFSKFRDANKYPFPKGREAANKIRDDLDAIIHESGVMGIAACVPMQDYKAIRASDPLAAEIFSEDAFETALQALFQRCYEIVNTEMSDGHRGAHRVAFVCDLSTSAPRIAKMYAEFIEKNPAYGEVFQGLVHRDDKKTPPLQAADLMAHLAKDRFVDWLKDQEIFSNEPVLKERLKKLSVYHIAACHKNWLNTIVEQERERRRGKTRRCSGGSMSRR